MPSFKSQQWEELLVIADQWRQVAAAYVDDPTEQPSRLGTLTYRLMNLCDEHTRIDTAPFWDFWRQVEVQTGRSALGSKVSQQAMETLLMRCVGLLDRLRLLGITTEPPAPQRDKAMEARDKWIYEQAIKVVPWETIKRRLTKKPKGWERLGSVSGVKKAAFTYAKRHNLPPPPPRKAGRPQG